MAEIVSKPSNNKYREEYSRIFSDRIGYGQCIDCIWNNQPEGCNVERDSKQCQLNRKNK